MKNWNEEYNTEEYVFGTRPNNFLVNCTAGLKPGKALCLGEGEGRNAVFLAMQGFEVTAVDLAANGLAKAQKLALENGVHLTTVCADVNEFDIGSNHWDLVICFFMHMPRQERAPVNRRVVKGLRQGGVYILEGFSREHLKYKCRGPKDMDKFYDLEDLQSELEGLEIRIGRQVDRLMDGLEPEQGMCAVTQVMAVKPLE